MKLLLATSLCLALPGLASAGPTAATVETAADALPFGGYGLGASIAPGATPHWRFGSTAYHLELPKFVTELDSANKGFSAELSFGIDVNVAYQLDPSGRGWFLEGIVPYERYTYTYGGMSTTVSDVSVIAGAGYQWLPFHNGLFVRPMLGASVRLASSGSTTVNGHEFHDPVVKPIPVIHVGYQF